MAILPLENHDLGGTAGALRHLPSVALTTSDCAEGSKGGPEGD